MYRLVSEIKIEKMDGSIYIFDKLSACHITYEMESHTATCTVELPRNIKWKNGKMPISVGDKIEIALGYDEELKKRFIGYITEIGQSFPLKLTCEDWMWRLKGQKISIDTVGDIKLSVLLGQCLKSLPYKVFSDVKMDVFRFTGSKIIDFLSQLKDEKGVYGFYKIGDKDPVLYIGKGKYTPSEQEKVYLFARGLNIIANNTKLIKDDKLSGSFTTFGVPEVDIYDRIEFQPDDEKSRCKYTVKNVTIDFVANDVKTNGYRQTITLGDKVTL